jgi:two-component system phosphate regulon sensor histidine kinase PhoR
LARLIPQDRLVIRLVLGLSVLLTATAALLFLLAARELTDSRRATAEATLRAEALLLEGTCAAALQGDAAEHRASLQALGRAAGIRITLIREDGSVLADSDADPAVMDNLASRPEVQASLTDEFGTCERFSPPLGVEFLFVARAIRKEGKLLGWIRVSVTTQSMSAAVDKGQARLGWQVALATAAALVLGMLGAIGLSRSRRASN